MKHDLKPCPFCGGKDLYAGAFRIGICDGASAVTCNGCGAIMPSSDVECETVIKQWNRRASLVFVPGIPQPRKIIQFERDGNHTVVLCDDGTMWKQFDAVDGSEWIFKCESPETQPAINPRVKDKLEYLERYLDRSTSEGLNALVVIDEIKELLYGENH